MFGHRKQLDRYLNRLHMLHAQHEQAILAGDIAAAAAIELEVQQIHSKYTLLEHKRSTSIETWLICLSLLLCGIGAAIAGWQGFAIAFCPLVVLWLVAYVLIYKVILGK